MCFVISDQIIVRFPLPLGACDRLRYYIVALPEPGFEGWIWVLIASVPVLCIPFAFIAI